MHAVTKFIIFFNSLCKPIEIYIYARKKHPFTSYPAAKLPKHNKFAATDLLEKPVDFFNNTARASNFANIGLFAKVSFPVGSIIPWFSLYNCSKSRRLYG